MIAPTVTQLSDVFAALRLTTPEYPAEMMDATRERLVEQVREGQEDSDDLWMLDGSNTDMMTQLQDAGYGSGGIM